MEGDTTIPQRLNMFIEQKKHVEEQKAKWEKHLEKINFKIKYYEDAAQYRSAVAVSADCIITRNKKDFSFSKLPVLTPDEFLRDRNFEDEA